MKPAKIEDHSGMSPQSTGLRLNLGCGMTPTAGWLNLDNSWSVRLARSPLAPLAIRLADAGQANFLRYVRTSDIRWADALRLPFAAGSVEVIYTSHMVEHLDRREARLFLQEAMRVLKSGGVLRIGVPDLSILMDEYRQTGDMDRFVERSTMTEPKPRGLLRKLVYVFLTGFRHHNWMYDGASVSKLLLANGFKDPIVQPPGRTRIVEPGALDLAERAASTVYVEALRS